MKLKTFLLLFAAILGIISASAVSAFGDAIVFDEFGNITIGGVPFAQGVVGQDPISGAFTLCYQLPFVANAGDMFIYEPPDQSQYSDMVRFPGNNQMYVFSDVVQGDLADLGALADMPLANWPAPQNNFGFATEVGTEGDNGAAWSPGFAGIGGDAVGGQEYYNFISDGVVPEPSSLLLAGLGGGFLLALRRRR